MTIKEFFNFDNFSVAESAIDLYGKIIREGIKYDVFSGKEIFNVKVLTKPMDLSDAAASSFFSSKTIKQVALLGFGDTSRKKFIFKGRIDDLISPHVFLPDPCSEEYANDREKAAQFISMHTTFVSTDSSAQHAINIGDVVNVRLNSNVFSYNLQYGEFMNLLNKSTQAQNYEKRKACQQLSNLFENSQFDFVGAFQDYFSTIVPGGSSGAGEVVEKNGITYFNFAKDFSVLDSSVSPDFEAFFQELKSLGYSPFITSARRSVKHQWGLYTGKLGTGYSTAKPCYSDHQYGFAIDMNATAPDGSSITKSSLHSYWTPIALVATNHDIQWFGAGDEVHFRHETSDRVLGGLKQKCKNYYESKYGTDPNSWPDDFDDEIQYIEPPEDDTELVASSTITDEGDNFSGSGGEDVEHAEKDV
jgi:hypothetical protein